MANVLERMNKALALDDSIAAAHLADRIASRIEMAGNLPLSNRAVPEKDDKTIRESILKPYRIIYQVDDGRNAIHILRIWHASRGVPDVD